MNGKLFNRLPLIKHLKWREYLAVRILWGDLTDKNNPYLARNAGSDVLMQFPDGSFIMDPSKPYVEVSAGVHNVFRFFHIEYVRRLPHRVCAPPHIPRPAHGHEARREAEVQLEVLRG